MLLTLFIQLINLLGTYVIYAVYLFSRSIFSFYLSTIGLRANTTSCLEVKSDFQINPRIYILLPIWTGWSIPRSRKKVYFRKTYAVNSKFDCKRGSVSNARGLSQSAVKLIIIYHVFKFWRHSVKKL